MRVLFILVLLVIPSVMVAQEIEESFEEWVQENLVEVPIGWSGTAFGSGKSSDAYSGEYSASIWNWYSYALGVLSIGEYTPTYLELNRAGIPVDFVPTRLTGYYRYTLGANQGKEDSAAVHIMLKRYDEVTGVADTLGFVMHQLPPSDSWQRFEIDIPLRASNVAPDSVAIVFFSSNPHNIARCNEDSSNCCYFSVDDLALVTTSGVQRSLNSFVAPVQVAPNPIRESARLRFPGEEGEQYRVLVYSIAGELVAERTVRTLRMDLSSLNLVSGAYQVLVQDLNDQPIASGRFVVD